MSVLLFTVLLFGTSLLAGLLGALTGLGGGVAIVPVLVLLFKVDLRYAIAHLGDRHILRCGGRLC